VACVPGLVMRRAADLYPGEAKTDRRDAYVLAGTGRTRRKQVHWLDAASDELLAALRVLNGFDIDLAADATRLASRLRDALTSISPALERALGERLGQPGVRDLLAAYPMLTALRAASQSRIERTVKERSPRIAAKVTAAVAAALAAQDVTVPAERATGRLTGHAFPLPVAPGRTPQRPADGQRHPGSHRRGTASRRTLSWQAGRCRLCDLT
jgi:Transposase